MILISLIIIFVNASKEIVTENIVDSETKSPFMKIAQHCHLTNMIASYLNEEYRKELRSRSKSFASKILPPDYVEFKTGRGKATARLETNFGAVETRGDPNDGGDSSTVATDLQSDVVNIFSTREAFAALKKDGSVITWGYRLYGGDSSTVAINLQSDVVNIFSTLEAFAALKKDGSVITWGHPNRGGVSSTVATDLQSDVVNIFSTKCAFAALKKDGSVITWGSSFYGGDSSKVAVFLSTGIVEIETIENGSKFRATKKDGSQVVWPN